MKLEHLLLGLLSGGRMSGYDISGFLENEGRFMRDRAHHTQVYRTLGRMSDLGWVDFEVRESDGRPDAKLYGLTAAGADELDRWLTAPYVPAQRYTDPEFKVRFLLLGYRFPALIGDLLSTELSARRAQREAERRVSPFLSGIAAADDLGAARVRRVYEDLADQGDEAFDRWIEWLAASVERYRDLGSFVVEADAR